MSESSKPPEVSGSRRARTTGGGVVTGRRESGGADSTERLRPSFVGLCLGVALLVGFVLTLSLFGLVPLRLPGSVASVPFDPERAVQRARLAEHGTQAAPADRLALWSFPLCRAPREAPRMYRVGLTSERDAFVVWCDGEFQLIDVQAHDDTPRVTRRARFSARAARPGGAVMLDLDRDGVRDLVLGVAPAAGVVHRAFSGLFWLRGRVQGGYELPRSLAETATVSLVAADLDGQVGSELVVLTRGDPVAQRPGELWIFAGGAAPRRWTVLPTALAPVDLTLGAVREAQTDVWVVASQPGSLLRWRLGRDPASWASAQRTDFPLRGAQAFVARSSEPRVRHVRDLLNVYAIENDEAPTPTLRPFRERAQVGPSVWIDGEGGATPALLAATQRGFAWFDGVQAAPRESVLPEGIRVVDVASVAAGANAARGVLLVTTAEQPASVALVVLSDSSRVDTSEVVLHAGLVDTVVDEARVALE